ncbi:CC137 protein, partial [Passerina amoena]|nr:CC137 protein [Passerina amoena]
MARGPAPGQGQKAGRGPRQKLGSGPKQGQRPGPKQGRGPGPGAGKGQKAGPGPGPGRKAGPGQGRKAGPGQKAGPRSEHGPAVPLRSRSEKKDNMKPKHPDEQEIPFRLRELMRSREALKRPEPGKKQQQQQQQKCQGPKAPGDVRVPRFRRGRGESERSYFCRMEREVQRVLFLAENQPQREPEKEATAPEKSKRKKEFQKRKLEKARKKKEEKKEAMLEKSLMQDTVPFGEVVTQPPTITSRPRGRGPAEQAGRKQLLLTPRLGHSQASPVSPVSPVVSMARRRILEEERARVIRAYRDIQRRKQLERERERARAGPG